MIRGVKWRILATLLVFVLAYLAMLAARPNDADAQGPVSSWHGTERHGGQGVDGGTLWRSTVQMVCGQGRCYQDGNTGAWIHYNGRQVTVYANQGNPVTQYPCSAREVANKEAAARFQPAEIPWTSRARAAAGAWATAAWEAMPAGEAFFLVVPNPYAAYYQEFSQGPAYTQ